MFRHFGKRTKGTRSIAVAAGLWLAAGVGLLARADEADDEQAMFNRMAFAAMSPEERAQTGFEMLIEHPFSSRAFTKDELNRLWTVWEEVARERAERAAPEERRRLIFERYGLIEREFDDTGLPLGYTDDDKGGLATNCFSCHGGKVAGRSIPGLPNTHQDLTGLFNDLARLRAIDAGRDPASANRLEDLLGIPLNTSRGVSNATMFSMVLGAMRDEHLNLRLPPEPYPITNNDMDAPPWWHFKKKEKIYCDAFAPPKTRALMQFTMSPLISGEKIRSWEDEFEYVKAYIESVEPPQWPWAIDEALAARGREAFERVCAKCHGTYGPDGEYPHKAIPQSKVGTDPVRLRAVSREAREAYNASWFAQYGEEPVDLESRGYLAPPLDGVWASAPYLHNGSIPTIYHLFYPETRPAVWRRSEDGYDREKMGLEVEEFEAVPEGLSERERRMFYDTSAPSHSNAGHLFPDQKLNDEEKGAVMEYLKTL